MFRLLACLVTAILLIAASNTARAAIIFEATMNGSQEVGPNASTASGFGTFILNDAMTSLTFTATVNGLDFTGTQTTGTTADNLTAAHIHASATSVPGVNAGVVWGFIGTPFSDTNPTDTIVTPFAIGAGATITSKWDAGEGNGTTLTDQLPNLLAGRAYINFHTVAFPGGEIRGQILAVPEPSTFVIIGIVTALGALRSRSKSRIKSG